MIQGFNITSVGGMLPLVLIPGSGSELYRGLGAVVVGGMLCSTIFTLILVPVLLSLALTFFESFKSRDKTLSSVTLVLMLLLVSSCESTEKESEMEKAENRVELPENWLHDDAHQEGDIQTWWEQFEDPILADLIQRARQNNLDLAMGLERLERSRATLSRQSRRKYLNTNVGAIASRSQYSENLKNSFYGTEAEANYNVSVQASWEMDFFGFLDLWMRSKEQAHAFRFSRLFSTETKEFVSVFCNRDI